MKHCLLQVQTCYAPTNHSLITSKHFAMSDCQIIFTFKDNMGDFHAESLRASRTGTCFRIECIPLFTPCISMGDIVCAFPKDDQLHFDMLIDRSGHSTIQVMFLNEEYIEPALQELLQLGCSFVTSKDKRLAAVNVPCELEYSLVQHYFEKGEAESKWSYKESALAHY